VSLFAIRHGETAWSLTGQHTGTTDIPLTDNGRRVAEQMRRILAGNAFAAVLCGRMQRARETCELVGLGNTAEIDSDLGEWNYGAYEGLTPKQIHEVATGWRIFRDGCPDGEAPEQVAARVDRIIARSRAIGDMALSPTDMYFEFWPRAGSGYPRVAVSILCWIQALVCPRLLPRYPRHTGLERAFHPSGRGHRKRS
jgi:hypothetical protein